MSLQDLLEVVPVGTDEEDLLRVIDFARLPRHVAIIMDGNGRWAQMRNKNRVEGHRAGIDAVRDTVETAARLGVEVLTLYAFSIENWKRPENEVSVLMGLLKHYLRSELDTLLKNNIRFRVVGRGDELAPDGREELARAEEEGGEERGEGDECGRHPAGEVRQEARGPQPARGQAVRPGRFRRNAAHASGSPRWPGAGAGAGSRARARP